MYPALAHCTNRFCISVRYANSFLSSTLQLHQTWLGNSTLNLTWKTDIPRIAKRWVRYWFFKWIHESGYEFSLNRTAFFLTERKFRFIYVCVNVAIFRLANRNQAKSETSFELRRCQITRRFIPFCCPSGQYHAKPRFREPQFHAKYLAYLTNQGVRILFNSFSKNKGSGAAVRILWGP